MDTGLASERLNPENLHEVVLDEPNDTYLSDEWPWVLLPLDSALPAEAGPSKPMTRSGYTRFRNMNAPKPAPGKLQPLRAPLLERHVQWHCSTTHMVMDIKARTLTPGEIVRHLSTEEIEELQMLGRAGFHAGAIVSLCRGADNSAALREIRRQVVLAEDSLSQGIAPGRESQGVLPDEELLGVSAPLLAAVKTALDECSSAKHAHIVRHRILHGQAVGAETQARRNEAVDDLFVASRKAFQCAFLESVMKLKIASEV